ncbi:hypothetical protein DL98DRAFT_549584 [Cadophora sp. DSE1049]|nr:hypothetical protein DL98DRAFT_549584 [Cadophora sp. DSE1049]
MTKPTQSNVTFLSRGIKIAGQLYNSSSSASNRKEDPAQRVEDIKSAVTCLIGTKNVDPERIGVLGICASGGHVCTATQTDLRIKSVATISAICLGTMSRDAAAKDRNGDAKREKATMIHMLPEKLEDAPADMPSAFRDFAEYYRTPRGIHPRAPNVALSRTRDLMTTYDAFHFNTMIALRPLLMIAGTKAETRDYSVDSLKMAEEPKELFGIEGKTHADLYDDYEGGLPKLVEFFEGFLAK